VLDDHAKGRAKAYEDEASTDEDGKVKVVQVIFHTPILNYFGWLSIGWGE
jgi:hypothetical protein